MLSPLFKCLYVKWPFGVCHLRWYSQPVTRSWKLFRLWHRINGYLGCFGKGPFRQFFSQFLSQWLIQLSVGEVGTYDKCVFHICFSDAFIYIYIFKYVEKLMSQCERRSQAHTCWRATHEHPGLSRKVGHVWYEVIKMVGLPKPCCSLKFSGNCFIQLFRIGVQLNIYRWSVLTAFHKRNWKKLTGIIFNGNPLVDEHFHRKQVDYVIKNWNQLHWKSTAWWSTEAMPVASGEAEVPQLTQKAAACGRSPIRSPGLNGDL
jgi:hypothetical protein